MKSYHPVMTHFNLRDGGLNVSFTFDFDAENTIDCGQNEEDADRIKRKVPTVMFFQTTHIFKDNTIQYIPESSR